MVFQQSPDLCHRLCEFVLMDANIYTTQAMKRPYKTSANEIPSYDVVWTKAALLKPSCSSSNLFMSELIVSRNASIWDWTVMPSLIAILTYLRPYCRTEACSALLPGDGGFIMAEEDDDKGKSLMV